MKEALEKALSENVLSLDAEGNFICEASGIGRYALNPYFNGKPCYFVNSIDAEIYADKIKCRVPVVAKIIGVYAPAMPLSSKAWKQIRIKQNTPQGKEILEILLKTSTLSIEKSENYSISLAVVSAETKETTRTICNPRLNKEYLYFKNSDDISRFSESFPKDLQGRLSIKKY